MISVLRRCCAALPVSGAVEVSIRCNVSCRTLTRSVRQQPVSNYVSWNANLRRTVIRDTLQNTNTWKAQGYHSVPTKLSSATVITGAEAVRNVPNVTSKSRAGNLLVESVLAYASIRFIDMMSTNATIYLYLHSKESFLEFCELIDVWLPSIAWIVYAGAYLALIRIFAPETIAGSPISGFSTTLKPFTFIMYVAIATALLVVVESAFLLGVKAYSGEKIEWTNPHELFNQTVGNRREYIFYLENIVQYWRHFLYKTDESIPLTVLNMGPTLLLNPITEEMFLHGLFFQRLLKLSGPIPAFACTSLLFSWYHVAPHIYKDTANSEIASNALFYVVYGLALSQAFVVGGGLLLPMCVHACYNAAFIAGNWYITR